MHAIFSTNPKHSPIPDTVKKINYHSQNQCFIPEVKAIAEVIRLQSVFWLCPLSLYTDCIAISEALSL